MVMAWRRLSHHRKGNAIWLALGSLALVSVAAFSLVTFGRNSLKQTGLAKGESELYWAAHAALADFGNRLKMTPWTQRFYRPANAGTGATPEYNQTYAYRGRNCKLWARDSVRAGKIQTDTTDILVEASESDLVLSLYQRVRIAHNTLVDPQVLHVEREFRVRSGLDSTSERDRVLATITTDEQAAKTNLPAADVHSRIVDDLAQRDATVAEVVGAATGAAGEVNTERQFRDAMERGRALLLRGSLRDAVSALNEALALARNSVAPQEHQRRVYCLLTLARAQYALALTTPAERNALLDQATANLDILVNEASPQCASLPAGLLRAQVSVARRNPRTRAQRDAALEETRRQLTQMTSTFPPGSIAPQTNPSLPNISTDFVNRQKLSLAYLDCAAANRSSSVRTDGHQESIVLTDPEGTTTKTITPVGIYSPQFWLPDGSALFVTMGDSNHGTGARYGKDAALIDREGNILQRFEGIGAEATEKSGGITLTPAGNQVVYLGMPDKNGGSYDAYWVQDLSGGPPRKLVEPGYWDGMFAHDPVQFSDNGRWTAYVDAGAMEATTTTTGSTGVKIARTDAFLGGTPEGRVAWSFERGATQPGMAWCEGGNLVRLVMFSAKQGSAAAPDDEGKLLLYDPETLEKKTSPAFPSGFTPSGVFPFRDAAKVVVMEASGSRYATIEYGADGFHGNFDLKSFSGGPFTGVPSRGEDNVVYLSDANANQGAIYRWDLAGDPVKLNLPFTTTAHSNHVLMFPVGIPGSSRGRAGE
jgi:hypothetical protein